MLRLCLLFSLLALPTFCQSMGTAGTVRGKVTDPSGAAIPGATVELSNDLTLYSREVITSSSGEFQFPNIPPNVYHLEINAPGFEHHHRDLTIRSAVPVDLEISLALAAQREAVTVSSEAPLMETAPSAHSDADRELFSKMPTASIATGLSDIITLSSPAVVADSDGFFHSLGDHAQMALSIDNQPITDQQGSLFSTQIPANAIESIEAVYGGTPAEYGDKTSLVVTAVTRSGLGQKTHGSFSSGYGSFGTFVEQGDVGFGGPKWGQFFAVNGSRSGRFLDPPEHDAFHDVGNNMNVFSRIGLSTGYFEYPPFGRTGRPQLVSGCQSIRSGGFRAGSEADGAYLQHWPRLGTCIWSFYHAGFECVRAAGFDRLLPEPRCLCRPAGHDEPDQELD